MTTDAPEYRGLVARTYDLFAGPTEDDELSFYRRRIQQSGDPVLEVGCGSGRLLLEFLAEGVDIDGVDNAPEMLDRCRAHATARSLPINARLLLQPMQALRTDRLYRTILVPASAFQLLTSHSDQVAALRAFHGCLHPEGEVVIFVADLWPGERAAARMGDWRLRMEATDEDGMHYRVWGRAHWDRDRKMNYDEERYERLVDDEIVEAETHESTMRWFDLAELDELLEQAMFQRVAVVDGFTDADVGDRTTTMHVIGRAV